MKPWRLSSISSMREVLDLLSAMLQAVSPNDRMAVKDEVIVDLVDRCRSNQKKLMQMLTTIGTTLLGHGSTSAHGFHGTTSKFGFGLFILVQVVLLLDFVHGWNDKWVGYDEQFWYAALLVVSLVCYVATISFASILFHWFAVKMIGYCNSKELQAVVCNLLKESLKQKLNQLGWIERMMIAIRVAKALDYLHSCSPPIIHRDIKSSNILLSNNCQPQLSDFGAAMVHQQT